MISPERAEKLKAALDANVVQLRMEGYSDDDIAEINIIISLQLLAWVRGNAPIRNRLFPRAVEGALAVLSVANEK